MTRILTFLLFVALVAAVAASGATFRPGEWYAALAKPSWTPPGWLFAPVWSVLYLMIAVAGWLIWREPQTLAARVAWGGQLVLNGAWSWLMFGQHQIGWALADIGSMCLVIAAFIALAWHPSRTAALLFVPYLAWVGFAAALNFEVWRLNT